MEEPYTRRILKESLPEPDREFIPGLEGREREVRSTAEASRPEPTLGVTVWVGASLGAARTPVTPESGPGGRGLAVGRAAALFGRAGQAVVSGRQVVLTLGT